MHILQTLFHEETIGNFKKCSLFSSLMSRNARNGENGETGEKSPAAGDLNWMPKVAPWRLTILAKMAILVKLAILAKIAMHAFSPMRAFLDISRFPKLNHNRYNNVTNNQ